MRFDLRTKLFLLALAPGLFWAPAAFAAERIQVVASQVFYEDLVREIGGDAVEAKHVASPKFNVHFFQPRPSDVRNVAKADLVVFTGLDLEAWWDPLMEAAGKPRLFRDGERSLDLSQGVKLLREPEGPISRAHGDVHLYGNPHYHMNPENAAIMAAAISAKLREIDPARADSYEANEKAFVEKLRKKIGEWKAACAAANGQEIVSYHDDVLYLADFLGMRSEVFLEPQPGIPPTPKHMAFVERYIREKGVKTVATVSYYPEGPAQAMALKTGAKVVKLALNAGEFSGTETVIGFFDYNFSRIAAALQG